MNHSLTSLDVFAGAGGITEGFRQAGFTCVFANDFNENAVETFALNHPTTEVVCSPIEKLEPQLIRKKTGLKRGELDVMVGGPPCQGFSINAPERFLDDPRNALFKHYLRFIDEFAPRMFLFENVPGMLSLGGGKIFDTVIRQFDSRGYDTSARILLAAHYGVPQVRWRMIILGSRVGEAPRHPDPTHFHMARPNFSGGRTLANRLLPLDEIHLKPAVNLRDAIGDLPSLKPGGGTEEARYDRRKKLSEFALRLRGDNDILYNHTTNAISKINLERLTHIPSGGSWNDIPFELLPSGMQKAKKGDHTKRYGRLTWESLAGTVMTKCDPHWGAVFHPDQARTYSVRETARFQSFPDAYRFLGPRVSQYEQIGNAVPVLMAKAIADSMRLYFESADHSKAHAS